MSPFYVVDPESMTGQGPFPSKEDAAIYVADGEVSSDTLVIFIGESGNIESVGDLNSLEGAETESN